MFPSLPNVLQPTDFKCNPVDLLTPEQLDRAIKARIARENAAKSTGPLTPEGKAIAARNAFKHGFASPKPIIQDSEREAYNNHLDAYSNRLQPRDQMEADVVRRIANAQWKLDLLEQTQLTILELEHAFQQPLIDATMDSAQLEPRHYSALAFQSQAGDRTLELANRYMQAAAREYDRAFRLYRELRSENSIVPAPQTPGDEEPPQKPATPNESTAKMQRITENPSDNSTKNTERVEPPLPKQPLNNKQQ